MMKQVDEMQDNSESKKILNDSDFAELMEAEYLHSRERLDDIAKQKIWKNTEKKLQQKDVHKGDVPWAKWAWLSVAALLLLSFVPIYYDFSLNSDIRTKGAVETIAANLTVYSLNDKGELVASNGEQKVGDRLVFKVSADHSGALALGLSKNSAKFEYRFIQNHFQAGKSHLLQNLSNTYAYMIEPMDQNLRFCAIMAANKAGLKHRLNNDSELSQDQGSCQNILVLNSLR